MQRRAFWVVSVGCLGFVLACQSALDAGSADNASESALSCATGQRAFNGQCRKVCQATPECSGAETCVKVDHESVCLDDGSAASCAFLDSDTQCVGTGGYYVDVPSGFRSSREVFYPYSSTPPYPDRSDVTPYHDPYFRVWSGYAYVYGDYGTGGCMGNARWVTAPRAGDPACAQKHDVVRCRRIGNQCALVPGVTAETPSP